MGRRLYHWYDQGDGRFSPVSSGLKRRLGKKELGWNRKGGEIQQCAEYQNTAGLIKWRDIIPRPTDSKKREVIGK